MNASFTEKMPYVLLSLPSLSGTQFRCWEGILLEGGSCSCGTAPSGALIDCTIELD